MLGIPYTSLNPCQLLYLHHSPRNMVEQIREFDVAYITIINPYSSLQCRLPSLCMSDENNT